MAKKFQRPKDTRDLLPADLATWQQVEEIARLTAEVYGYSEIRTPVFEPVELFARTIGASTDIVEKEMYAFETAGGDKFALRPEGTAGICRAYLEAGMHKSAPFQKFWYSGPMFRHDKPQKGRYRQFWQFGVEAFGSDDPLLDAEVVRVGAEIIEKAGIDDVSVKLSSIGCMEPDCRPAYREKLKAYFEGKKDELCGDCRRRLETNVLRIFDCKVPGCGEVASAAPKPLDNLCDECAAHFEAVKSGLDAREVIYDVDPMIVRGLDYYTRTVFEYFAEGVEGSQDALGGGGRYDGLIEILDGPHVPAIGLALGLDRIVGRCPVRESDGTKVHIISPSMNQAAQRRALVLSTMLRQRGIQAVMVFGNRSVKSQERVARKSGADFAVIWSPEQEERGVVKVKPLKGQGRQEEVREDELCDWIVQHSQKE